jgi:hypothetical protein
MRLLLLLALATLGCSGAAATGSGGGGGSAPAVFGGGGGAGGGHAVSGCEVTAPPSRFASCVLSFEPGVNAGFGQVSAVDGGRQFPEIVYGPPEGAGTANGSTDVLSLGGGGEIAVGFGGAGIFDGPGVDFIVFENSFLVGGDPSDPYAEPGVVSVSEDAVTWVEFPCHKEGYPFTGCAGWHPVLSNPDNGISPFDPATAGGDPFDLADVGVKQARYVRVRDVSFFGGGTSEGFDLDAVAIVNAQALR